MAIPSKPRILNNVIAHNGDKTEIPESTPVDSGQPSVASGWPRITSLPLTSGGVAPSREGFNGMFNLLSQHLFFQQSGMLYSWDSTLNYPTGSVIRTSNGIIYLAIADNGPDYSGIGSRHPAIETNYWVPLIADNAVTLAAGGTGAKNAAGARNNLGLGNSAILNTGVAANTVAIGNHNHDAAYQPKGSYATTDHSHDEYATSSALTVGLAEKSNTKHNHSGVYQPVGNYASILSLFEANGYCNIGGCYFQWGKITHILEVPGFHIDFPVAFPNACFACTLSLPDNGGDSDYYWRVYDVTKSGFNIRQKCTGSIIGSWTTATAYFIAIGF